MTDQLALWEAENFRIKTQEAVVVECRDAIQSALLNFKANAVNAPEIFGSLVQNLKKIDVLLWENAETMTIAISPVDNFIRVVQSYIESCVSNIL